MEVGPRLGFGLGLGPRSYNTLDLSGFNLTFPVTLSPFKSAHNLHKNVKLKQYKFYVYFYYLAESGVTSIGCLKSSLINIFSLDSTVASTALTEIFSKK